MKGKSRIITFKVDDALGEALEDIDNRSEFIRAAILAALDGVCPLCLGTGVLNERQRRHWNEFRADHDIERCDRCNVPRLVCRQHSVEVR